MTPNTRKALIRKIKTGQGWCRKHLEGFDEDAYRRLLKDYGGAKGEPPSSLDPEVDLNNVIARLHELGFPDQRPARAGKPPAGAASKQALLGKIDAYLAEAKLPTAYADGIARRMYKIQKYSWCGIPQLRGIVAALQKAAEKAGRATA